MLNTLESIVTTSDVNKSDSVKQYYSTIVDNNLSHISTHNDSVKQYNATIMDSSLLDISANNDDGNCSNNDDDIENEDIDMSYSNVNEYEDEVSGDDDDLNNEYDDDNSSDYCHDNEFENQDSNDDYDHDNDYKDGNCSDEDKISNLHDFDASINCSQVQCAEGISHADSSALSILSCLMRHNVTASGCREILQSVKATLLQSSEMIKFLDYDALKKLGACSSNNKEIHYCYACSKMFPEDPDEYICKVCKTLRYKGDLSFQCRKKRMLRASFVIADVGKQLEKLLLSPGNNVCMSLHLTIFMVVTVNLILN